jgi:hypothetical protein
MNKKNFKIIYLLSLFVIVSSCVVPRYLKESYIGCYDGIPTGIDSLLDLSGYFLATSSDPFARGYTRCLFLIFYNDGMAFHTGGPIQSGGCNTYMQSQLQEAYPNRLSGGQWGLYELKNNTIKIELVRPASPPETYSSEIARYIILDRHTIQEVIDFENINDVKATYHFVPVEKLPSSECWLKSQKWFWCDEKQYQQYYQP